MLLATCTSQPTRQAPANANAEPTLVPTAVPSARTLYTVERGDVVYDATFAGQLLSFNLSPGYAISAFTPIGSIADMEQLEVSATVRDKQLEELSEEMAVLIMPANRPGEAVPGVIRQMPYPYGSGGGGSDIAEADPRTRFSFDNLEDAANFDAGDRVDILMVITEKDNVLFLPPSAVRDFNGRKFVVVQDGDVQERVDVELGIRGNGRLEIISGLEEGQTIVCQ